MQKVPYTMLHKALMAFSVVVTLGMALWLLLNWSAIPPVLPIHYGFSGAADAWGGKGSLWLLWLIGVSILVLMLVVGLFPKTWNVCASAEETIRPMLYAKCRTLLCLLEAGITVLIAVLTLASAMGKELIGWWLWLALALICGPVIWYFASAARIRRAHKL